MKISCGTENGLGTGSGKLEIFEERKLGNGFEIRMNFIDYGVQFQK